VCRRFSVDELIGVRRVGRYGRMEAQVSWTGADEDGLPHEPSWVHISFLTPDLRKEARRRLGARVPAGRSVAMKARRQPTRVSARAARQSAWRQLAEDESASEGETDAGGDSGDDDDESEGGVGTLDEAAEREWLRGLALAERAELRAELRSALLDARGRGDSHKRALHR
jgi:hypothetical protein